MGVCSPRRMNRRWARVAAVVALVVVGKVLWVAGCRPRGADVVAGADRDEVEARLAYLVERQEDPGFVDDTMLSPGGIFASEWRLVSLSMTAAALVNVTFAQASAEPSRRAAAAVAVDRLLEQALREEIRSFDTEAWGEDALTSLQGDGGHVGYLGHLVFMLGARRALGGEAPEVAARHEAICAALGRRMAASPSRHLDTYPRAMFTADNSVAVAGIALCDLASGERRYRSLLDEWVAYTREHLLDPETGIILFCLDGQHRGTGGARASGAGYNSFYLPFVDAALAKEQYQALRDHYLVQLPFGAQAFREWPIGVETGGDVDSGPLVFGLSPSASGFAIAGARHAGDAELLDGLLLTAEGAGFTAPRWSGRAYLLSPLVGDAIVLAMRTATTWDARFRQHDG
jgi:hypothetical protein